MNVRKPSSVSPPVQVQNPFQPRGHQQFPFFGAQVPGQEDLQVRQIIQHQQHHQQGHQHTHHHQQQQQQQHHQHQQQQYPGGFSSGAGPHDMNKQLQPHVHQASQSTQQQGMQQVMYPQAQSNPRPPTPGYVSQRPIQQNIRSGQRPPISMSTSPSQAAMFQAPHMYMQPQMLAGQPQMIIQQAPGAPPMQVPAFNQRMQQPFIPSGQFMQANPQQPYFPQSNTAPGVYYNPVPMPTQQRPIAPAQPPANYPKREKKMLRITDPNTGKDISEEILAPQGGSKQSTPPLSGSSSSRATPVGTSPPQGNDIAAQFAAQVAATLTSNRAGEQQCVQAGMVPQHPHEMGPGMGGAYMNSMVGGEDMPPVVHPMNPGIMSHPPPHTQVPPPEQQKQQQQQQQQQQHTVPVIERSLPTQQHHQPHHQPHIPHEHSQRQPVMPAVEPMVTMVPEVRAASEPPMAISSVDNGVSETVPAPQMPAPVATPAPVAVAPVAPVAPVAVTVVPAMTEVKEVQQIPAKPEPVHTHTTQPSLTETKERTPEPQQSSQDRRPSVEKSVKSVPESKPQPTATTVSLKESRETESKSNNKKKNQKQKMRNLNQKGEKEGSDMDAFTDESSPAATAMAEEKTEAAAVPEVNGLASPVPEMLPGPTKTTTESATIPDSQAIKPIPAAQPQESRERRASQDRDVRVKDSKPVPADVPVAAEPQRDISEVQKRPASKDRDATQSKQDTRSDSKDRDNVADVKAKDVVNQSASTTKEHKDVQNVEKVSNLRQSVDKDVSQTKDDKDAETKVTEPVRTATKPPVDSEKPLEHVDNKVQDSKVSALNEKNVDSKRESSSEKTLEKSDKPDETVIIEEPQRLKLDYKDDQWSPLNPAGKKHYDRSFLLQLQYSNESVNKPTGLPELPDVILDRPILPGSMRNDDGMPFIAPRTPGNIPDFTPKYIKSGASSDRRGPGSMSRGSRSQQKNRDDRDGRDGRGGKGEPRKIINISIGSADVKLHQTKNAWKPQPLSKEELATPDGEEAKTQEVFKKVRSILNKLTPQKFDTLLKQIRDLEINTPVRLRGAIDLIFEKAIDEPNFAVAYGRLCKELSEMKVVSNAQSDRSEPDRLAFNKVLLNRCQMEFQKDNSQDVEFKRRRKEIESAPESEKKLLQATLDMDEARAKRRSVGNIRFIGELFKLNMLTMPIIIDCVKRLLVEDDDSLECLCRLLTTIGKVFDVPKAKSQVDNYFAQIEKLSHNRKVSSRIRFLMQDVLDLRRNNWVPRRDDNNPKTIDQIHKEAQQEDIQKSMMVEQYNMQQKQRGSSGPPRRPPQGFGTPNQSDDGWQSVGKNNRNLNQMDPERMKLTRHEVGDNIQLGGGFSSWGKGSRGGIGAGAGMGAGMGMTKSSSMEGERPPTQGSRFAALSGRSDNYDNRGGRRMSDRPGDKGRLLTPSRGKNISRLSQEQDRDAALSAARSIVGHSRASSSPMGSRNQSRESSRNRGAGSREGSRDRKREPTPAAPAAKELSRDVMEKKSKAILEEYLGINDLKECITCVQELNSPSNMHLFVSTSVTDVIEKSASARQRTGALFYELVSQRVISLDHYITGLAELLEFAEDMAIDIPKIYQYLGELIGPMIQESGAVPLATLKKILQPLNAVGKAGIVAAEVLKNAVSRLGADNVEQQWRASELAWSDFLPQGENVGQFVKKHNLEFTQASNVMSMDRIRAELDRMLVVEKANNEIVNAWIEANVGAERAAEPAFIRALMTSVCSSAITANKSDLDLDKITPRSLLFHKYLDHKTERELQALYALQALVHRLDHPAQLLKKFFDCLYDEDIISEDAFHQWNSSEDPAELQGKGVAKTSVQQFFTWLREAEDEEA